MALPKSVLHLLKRKRTGKLVDRENLMLTTLIRRELLDNLMTFRFAAAVFITLLLVVANTVVLLKDYEPVSYTHLTLPTTPYV